MNSAKRILVLLLLVMVIFQGNISMSLAVSDKGINDTISDEQMKEDYYRNPLDIYKKRNSTRDISSSGEFSFDIRYNGELTSNNFTLTRNRTTITTDSTAYDDDVLDFQISLYQKSLLFWSNKGTKTFKPGEDYHTWTNLSDESDTEYRIKIVKSAFGRLVGDGEISNFGDSL